MTVGAARWALCAVLAVACAVPVAAEAPTSSLRPQARAGSSSDTEVHAAPSGTLVRPQTRVTNPTNPVGPSAAATGAAIEPDGPEDTTEGAKGGGGFLSRIFRPKQRQLPGNMICGIPDVRGKVVGRVPGKQRGCGIAEAVLVESVAGVTLSPAALVNCGTAQSLRNWVEAGVKPAFGARPQLTSLTVAAHYSCRTRNNQRGAKLSEHSKGNAIDISAFNFADGSSVSVLKDWGRGRSGRKLLSAWQAACGPFGTVLGPRADRFHKDHFHMDTARYRSGAYCR
ncbi:extensin-like domain-containing protein [Chachezhania sediminis]|uniref:extensin-like domain-containing protein n=1 Tax=Chachezhania sediminis TaxID=2599291 RepID=UPI001E5A61CC|nr:extensin family protein [Chachezhania sediminis]